MSAKERTECDFLSEVVPPDGPGWMTLYHAALWIATRGGKVKIDPSKGSFWKPSYDELTAQIADGNVHVMGIRYGEREPVPAHIFAGIRVSYPSGDNGLWFEDEVHLCSYRYVDEHRWLGGSDDSLYLVWDKHGSLENPLEALRTPRWKRLLVQRSDVRRLWGFYADPNARDVVVGIGDGPGKTPPDPSAAFVHGTRDCRVNRAPQADDPVTTKRPGRPSSRALVEEEYKRRAEAGERADSIAEEGRILSRWLKNTYPAGPQATPKTVEAQLRSLWKKDAINSL